MLEKQTSRLIPDEIERYAHLFDERAIYEADNKVAYRNGEIHGRKEGRIQIIHNMICSGLSNNVILQACFMEKEIKFASQTIK